MSAGEVAVRNSSLSIAAEQQEFSRGQVEALKKMNGWSNVPDHELSVFFHQAKRTGLDPFAKQIYLIGRGGKYTIQTSIDGMRLVADKTGRYAGSDRPQFGEEDGEKYAEITVWKLVGTPATRVAYTGVAFESEYAQNTPIWRKMPKTMLAKCAEAQALRKAFPADLSGVYGQEEMDQAGPPTDTHTTAQPHGTPDRSGEPEVIEEAEVVDHPSRPDRPRGQSSSGKRETGRADKLTNDQAKRLAELAVEYYGEQGVRELQMKVLKGKQITTLNRQNADKVIAGLEAKIQSRDGYDNEDDEDEAELTTEASTSGVEGLSEEDMSDIESIFKQQEQDSETDEDEPRARKSQVDLLKALIIEEHGEGAVEKFNERTGRKLEELNRAEADQMIDMLTPEDA